MDIVKEEVDRATGRSNVSAEVSKGSTNAGPPRPFTHGSEHGASSSVARPPLISHLELRRLSCRVAARVTRARRSTTKILDPLAGFEEVGEGQGYETPEAGYNQPGSYVDQNNVFHVEPRTGVLEREGTDAELSEGAQEDHDNPN